jgi:hypothetical protein
MNAPSHFWDNKSIMASVNLDKNLYEQAKRVAAADGYSSVEEFIVHAVEVAIRQSKIETDAESQVSDQLRGLGYIN